MGSLLGSAAVLKERSPSGQPPSPSAAAAAGTGPRYSTTAAAAKAAAVAAAEAEAAVGPTVADPKQLPGLAGFGVGGQVTADPGPNTAAAAAVEGGGNTTNKPAAAAAVVEEVAGLAAELKAQLIRGQVHLASSSTTGSPYLHSAQSPSIAMHQHTPTLHTAPAAATAAAAAAAAAGRLGPNSQHRSPAILAATAAAGGVSPVTVPALNPGTVPAFSSTPPPQSAAAAAEAGYATPKVVRARASVLTKDSFMDHPWMQAIMAQQQQDQQQQPGSSDATAALAATAAAAAAAAGIGGANTAEAQLPQQQKHAPRHLMTSQKQAPLCSKQRP